MKCTGLEEILLANGLERINASAFQETRIRTIRTPKTVDYLGEGVFKGCVCLEDLTEIPFVGSKIENTGKAEAVFGWIFGELYQTDTTITDSLYLSDDLETRTLLLNPEYFIPTTQYYSSSEYATYYIPASLESLTITKETIIGRGAFYNCKNLKHIYLPQDSIVNVLNYAFYYCQSLEEMEIPNQVSTILSQTFNYCSHLKTLIIPFVGTSGTADGEASVFGIIFGTLEFPDGCSYEAKQKYSRTTKNSDGTYTTETGVISYYVPKSLKNIIINNYTPSAMDVIPYGAFSDLRYVERIEISGTARTVSDYAFYNCTALKDIKTVEKTLENPNVKEVCLPNTITSIGAYAFAECINLEDVILPDSLQRIGDYAFENLHLMKVFEMPSCVTNIGRSILRGCSNVETLSVSFLGDDKSEPTASTKYLGYLFGTWADSIDRKDKVRNNSTLNTKIQADMSPANTLVGTYYTTTAELVGSYYYTITDRFYQVVENGVTYMMPKSLKYLTISNALELVNQAVMNVNTLITVDLTESTLLKTIGDEAFRNDNHLEELYLPEDSNYGGTTSSLTRIGSYAFYNCPELRYARLPDGLKELGDYAFAGQENLRSKLESVRIPASLVVVGNHAFEYNGLTHIDLYNQIISNYMFYDNDELESLFVPKNVNIIGDYAFTDCDKLLDLVLEENYELATSYDESKIYYDKAFTRVYISGRSFELGKFYQFDSETNTYVLATEYDEDTQLYELNYVRVSRNKDEFEETMYYVLNNSTYEKVTSFDPSLEYYQTYYEEVNVTASEYQVDTFYVYDQNSRTHVLSLDPFDSNETYYRIGYQRVNNVTLELFENTRTYVYNENTEAYELTVEFDEDAIYYKRAYYETQILDNSFIPDKYYYKDGNNYVLASLYDATKEYYLEVYKHAENVDSTNYSNYYVITSGLTALGEHMFEDCDRLTVVSIPYTIAQASGSVRQNVFANCKSLTTIIVNNSKIGQYMFYNDPELISVTWNEKIIDTLGAHAFENDSRLESLPIPELIEEILPSTFKNCRSFTEIIIPSNVRRVWQSAFENCSNVSTLEIHTSGLKPNLVGLETIDDAAFKNIPLVEELVIPSTVTTIAGGAFNGASYLETLTIPFAGQNRANTTDPDQYHLFGYIFGSTKYNNSYDVSQTFDGESGTITYWIPRGLTSVTVTDDTYVTDGAFNGLTSLKEINLSSENLAKIGDFSFEGCTSLTSIIIPNTVDSLGERAFAGCYRLHTLEFEDGSTCLSIGAYAFKDCIALTSLVIPNVVETIGESVFSGMVSLEELTIPFIGKERGNTGTEEALFGYMFGSDYPLYHVYDSEEDVWITPMGAAGQHDLSNFVATLQACDDTFATIVYYLPISLTTLHVTDESKVGFGAFYNVRTISDITINENVLTSIEDYAFYNMYEMVYGENTSYETTLPGLVEYNSEASHNVVLQTTKEDATLIVGRYAFAVQLDIETSQIASLRIDDTVSNIGDHAFYNNDSLVKITLENSMLSESEFEQASGLNEIVIPECIVRIDQKAFYDCDNLETITLENHFLGYKMFEDCDLLETLVIPAGINILYKTEAEDDLTGVRSFAECDNLKYITINNRFIYDYMFYGCDALEEMDTTANGTNGITYIGYAAFGGCSTLDTITIPFVGNHKYTVDSKESLFGYIFGETEIASSTDTVERYSSLDLEDEETVVEYTFYIPTSLSKVIILPFTGAYADLTETVIGYGAFMNAITIDDVIATNITTIKE